MDLKSRYGKNLSYPFLPDASLQNDQLFIREVPSSFNPSEELREKVKVGWDPVKKGEDGTKWRYEGITPNPDGTFTIEVSPIMYSEHDILRGVSGLKPEDYPTPFTVNTIQITSDNCFMLAIRGEGSDQRGIASLGCGFCDRHVVRGNNIPPSHPFDNCKLESLEESLYTGGIPPFSDEKGFLGIARGSNTDVTAIFYQFLNVDSSQVTNNPDNLGYNKKPEHTGVYPLRLEKRVLEDFLQTGEIKDYPGVEKLVAADHLLGCAELLLHFGEFGKGKIILSNRKSFKKEDYDISNEYKFKIERDYDRLIKGKIEGVNGEEFLEIIAEEVGTDNLTHFIDEEIHYVIERGYIVRDGKREKLRWNFEGNKFMTKYGHELSHEEYLFKKDKAIKKIVRNFCNSN